MASKFEGVSHLTPDPHLQGLSNAACGITTETKYSEEYVRPIAASYETDGSVFLLWERLAKYSDLGDGKTHKEDICGVTYVRKNKDNKASVIATFRQPSPVCVLIDCKVRTLVESCFTLLLDVLRCSYDFQFRLFASTIVTCRTVSISRLWGCLDRRYLLPIMSFGLLPLVRAGWPKRRKLLVKVMGVCLGNIMACRNMILCKLHRPDVPRSIEETR